MWDGGGVESAGIAPYRTHPANTSFRPTLPDRCSRIPGICNAVEHDDFGAMFQESRDL